MRYKGKYLKDNTSLCIRRECFHVLVVITSNSTMKTIVDGFFSALRKFDTDSHKHKLRSIDQEERRKLQFRLLLHEPYEFLHLDRYRLVIQCKQSL